MKFNVITIFPEFFSPFLSTGVIGKAIQKNRAQVSLINTRAFATDKHQSIDSPPYGGGDGMLMKYQPLKRALQSLKEQGALGRVYNFSPQGPVWSHQRAQEMAALVENQPCTFLCGRYAGIDQRLIEQFVDEEISLGDYILSGAELAAQVVIDSTLRFVPGVLGHPESHQLESFTDNLLEAPQYTQPQWVDDLPVPEVLLSGHHKKIDHWKKQVAIVKTAILRPDLLAASDLTKQDTEQAFSFVCEFSDQQLQVIGLNRKDLNAAEKSL